MQKQSLHDRAIQTRIWQSHCTACGHSWGHHLSVSGDADKRGDCDECYYEESHQERETDAPLCKLPASPELWQTPPSPQELEDAIPYWTKWRARQRDRLRLFRQRF